MRELVLRGDGNAVRVEVPREVRRWSPSLLDGYEQSAVLPGKLILGVLRNQHRRHQIKRELKQLAVDAMSAGADVRDLTRDAVPVIAYALLLERLPTTVVPGSAEAWEQVNDLLLQVSSESADPAGVEASPLFVDLFKLSVTLGEAQRYANQLSLTTLQLGGSGGDARVSRRSIITGLALFSCGAVAAALAGFALGAAGNGGSPLEAGGHRHAVERRDAYGRRACKDRHLADEDRHPDEACPADQGGRPHEDRDRRVDGHRDLDGGGSAAFPQRRPSPSRHARRRRRPPSPP